MTEESKYATLASHMHIVKSRNTSDVNNTIIDNFTNCLRSTQITGNKISPIYILVHLMDPDF